MSRSLIVLELNELNFEVVREYIDAGNFLPNFSRLLAFDSIVTTSEKKYHLLEPWIQWPSVHTGQTYHEHQIFRLGDAGLKRPKQLFELVESNGFSVGAISPMNAFNALENPTYFVPDPWTDTKSDRSMLSVLLTKALKQTVNDNSKGKITFQSALYLGICFIFCVRPSFYLTLFVKALKSRAKPWRKALFLDRLLHEIHMTLFNRYRPNFSTLFLNAGAHIQHHYFLSSSSALASSKSNPEWYVSSNFDPLKEMLFEYDEMLGDIFANSGTEVLIATGLTQKPVDHGVFYYRLRDHAQFLSRLRLRVEKVEPRMTRDFLVSCGNEEDAILVETQLSKVVTRDGTRVFGEIDNRGCDLFVVLDYPFEVTDNTEVLLGNSWCKLSPEVVFVAVKNGEHEGRGFAYFSPGLVKSMPSNKAHVSKLFNTVCEYFDIDPPIHH